LLRRRLRLTCLSAAFFAGAAAAAPAAPDAPESPDAPEAIVAEFRLGEDGERIVARAWRSDGEIAVLPETLTELGIAAPAGARIPLSSVPGLSYRFDEALQAVIIACDSACFERRLIRAAPSGNVNVSAARGFFLNGDLVASRVDGAGHAAGAFDLGLFGAAGYGGTSWTLGAAHDRVVRLETAWTVDFIEERARLVLGDGLAPQGAAGPPIRYGGVRFGTDFSLDPRFVTFATPSIAGEAATPSVVDLYVNGALRLREPVEAGPFAIVDAPLVTGGGAARVVVTDVLGREQVIEAPFYASPNVLRRGLAAYDVTLGAERRAFGYESFSYGPAFAAASYRRGLADWVTAGARVETREGGGAVGGTASFAQPWFGQVDLDGALSSGAAGEGAFAQLSWAHTGRTVHATALAAASSGAFRPLGMREAPPRLALRGSFGFDLGAAGAFNISAAQLNHHDGARRGGYGINYSNAVGALGSFALSALVAEDGAQRSVYVGLTFVRALSVDSSAAAIAEHDDRGLTAGARFSHTPPRDEGLTWRAALADGVRPRAELGVAARSHRYEARLEAGRLGASDGVRAQFAGGIVAVDGHWAFSAPVRGGFALVDVGAPNVAVRHERQIVGRTDRSGRLLFTGLRPYDQNRISIDIEDIPLRARLPDDEMMVRPAARSGVVVHFALERGAGGEIRVTDADGAPLQRGAMLVRERDGARFPVGRDGRVYISGVGSPSTLRLEAARSCAVEVSPASVSEGASVLCVR